MDAIQERHRSILRYQVLSLRLTLRARNQVSCFFRNKGQFCEICCSRGHEDAIETRSLHLGTLGNLPKSPHGVTTQFFSNDTREEK